MTSSRHQREQEQFPHDLRVPEGEFVKETPEEYRDTAAQASEFHKRVLSRGQFDVGGALNPGDSSLVSSQPNWGLGVVAGPNKGDPFINEHHQEEGFLGDRPGDDENHLFSPGEMTPGDIHPHLAEAKKSGHMVRITTDPDSGMLHITRTRRTEHIGEAADIADGGTENADLSDLGGRIGDINPHSEWLSVGEAPESGPARRGTMPTQRKRK